MKIRHLLLPSGITEGIPLLIEARWTPEQAVAVFELLDDLREQIVRHYTPQIQAYYGGNPGLGFPASERFAVDLRIGALRPAILSDILEPDELDELKRKATYARLRR